MGLRGDANRRELAGFRVETEGADAFAVGFVRVGADEGEELRSSCWEWRKMMRGGAVMIRRVAKIRHVIFMRMLYGFLAGGCKVRRGFGDFWKNEKRWVRDSASREIEERDSSTTRADSFAGAKLKEKASARFGRNGTFLVGVFW